MYPASAGLPPQMTAAEPNIHAGPLCGSQAGTLASRPSSAAVPDSKRDWKWSSQPGTYTQMQDGRQFIRLRHNISLEIHS